MVLGQHRHGAGESAQRRSVRWETTKEWVVRQGMSKVLA